MRVIAYKDDLESLEVGLLHLERRVEALEIELKKLLAAVKRSKASKKKTYNKS